VSPALLIISLDIFSKQDKIMHILRL